MLKSLLQVLPALNNSAELLQVNRGQKLVEDIIDFILSFHKLFIT